MSQIKSVGHVTFIASYNEFGVNLRVLVSNLISCSISSLDDVTKEANDMLMTNHMKYAHAERMSNLQARFGLVHMKNLR